MSDDFQARPRAALVFDEDAPIEDGLFTAPATPEPVFDQPSDRVFLARRSDGSRERDTDAEYLQVRLNGELESGQIRHRLALGADYRAAEATRYFLASPTTDGVPVDLGGAGPLFELRDPVYGRLPQALSTDGLPLLRSDTSERGLFANDYIDLTERVALLVGARLDVVDPDGDGPADSVDEISPQVAVNYQVADQVSLFASYSEAFEPNTGFALNADGSASETELFDPEDSRQYEVGAKAELLEGRLSLSSALYQIDKRNVVTVVDSVPMLVEGQSSSGLELRAAGQPRPGMNVVAGYAYTDAEVETGTNAGNRPRNVAERTFNLWGSYEIQSGPAAGLGAGLGAFYTSNRYGDDANSWSLGSYTLVDASLWYSLPDRIFEAAENVRVQLAVKNLLDEEYYPASGGDLRVSIGAPRTIYASISATF